MNKLFTLLFATGMFFVVSCSQPQETATEETPVATETAAEEAPAVEEPAAVVDTTVAAPAAH